MAEGNIIYVDFIERKEFPDKTTWEFQNKLDKLSQQVAYEYDFYNIKSEFNVTRPLDEG